MTGIERRKRFRAIVPVVLSAFDLCGPVGAYLLAAAVIPSDQARLWMDWHVWMLGLIAWAPAAWRLVHRSRYRALKMERTASDAVNAAGCHAMVFLSLLYITSTPGPDWRSFCVFYALLLLLLPAARTTGRVILKIARSRGRNYSKVVIVGTNETAVRLCSQLGSDPGFGYKVLAFFDEQPGRAPDPTLYRGTVDELDEYVKAHRIDEIFCTLSGENTAGLRAAIAAADANEAQYYYVPQLSRYVARSFGLDTLGSMTVLPGGAPPLSGYTAKAVKRLLDLTIAGITACLFPVVFIPVAIAIKLTSKGPVFYRQKRSGYRGTPFDCLKFRTMRFDPEDESPVEKNDPRVTSVGRFLRHTSIDELPQIFNVLAGHMSIVGPRPHMVSHTERYRELIDRYMMRLTVKPGITGWAQVNGYRGPTDYLWKMERRVEHDVWYIENWSLMLDLKIIARTFLNLLRGEPNAY